MKIMLPPRREHDFHKITVFTFSSNFEPKWDPKSKDFDQKRAQGDSKITKMPEKSVFLVDQNLNSNFGRKKTEKERIGCTRWSLREGGSAPWRAPPGGEGRETSDFVQDSRDAGHSGGGF